MGLDMYLTGKRFIWHSENVLESKLRQTLDIDYEVEQVEIKVGYWRKANQIHKWFVDNIQDGNDDCNEYEVSEEKLQKLLQVVNEALKSKTPEIILPTQGGFFFGDTEYDEWYVKDLENTKQIIEKYLSFKDKAKYELYYRSSW